MISQSETDGPAAVTEAAALGAARPLSAAVRSALHEAADVPGVIRRLVDGQNYRDAVGVLAYTLPVRRAVWWACLCTWHGMGGPGQPPREPALGAAVTWVLRPSAHAHAEAAQWAEAIEIDNAAGCCARAAAAAGHATTAGGALLGARPRLVARLCESAALYAQLERRGREPAFDYHPLVTVGIQVALGEVLWNGPTEASNR